MSCTNYGFIIYTQVMYMYARQTLQGVGEDVVKATMKIFRPVLRPTKRVLAPQPVAYCTNGLRGPHTAAGRLLLSPLNARSGVKRLGPFSLYMAGTRRWADG